MSYLVLARKYRPRSFTEMVGQEHVVQALSNALVQQRLHHAYLFTGTRGVGKTTVSRVLAKSLNCQGLDGTGGITAQPCGQCAACRDIDAGRFVDYTELDAASNRGVDEVQSLLEQAVYKPVQGRFKVFMIDEVHMLTNTAFNAMLKTLEEPPEYLKFVLATTDPQKVPATVLSRCLQFNLRPMAPETVFEHLGHVLAQERIEAEPAALRLLARAARGSMRDALSLTDQAIAFGSGQLQEAGVRQMLGSVDRDHVVQLIAALARGDGAQVVALVEALRVQGVGAAATLEDMAAVLHRMAVCQAVPGMAPDGDADPDQQAAHTLAQAMSAEETQLLYSLCLHGRTELGLAPDEYAALVMVLLRLLAFQPANRAGRADRAAPPSPAAQPEAEKKSPDNAAAQRSPLAAPPASQPRNAKPETQRAIVAPALAQASAQNSAQNSAQSSAHSTTHTAHPPAPARATSPAPSTPPDDDSPPWDDWDTGDAPTPQRPPEPAPTLQALPVRHAPAPGAATPSRADVLKRPQLPLQPTPQGEVWMAAVSQLLAAEAITALVRELALQSQLMAHEGGVWQLQVDSESLLSPSLRERLQAALHAHGQPVQLQVSLGAGVSDSPAKRMAQQASARQQAAQHLMDTDPRVQTLVRNYGAHIVPGSAEPI